MEALIPFVTTSLSIPASRLAEVSAKLATGTYVRIGGVIRESATGRIVLWLRPGPNLGSALRLATASNVLSLTLSTMSLEYVRQKINLIEKEIKQISAQLARIEKRLNSAYIAQLQSALAHAQIALDMKGPQNRFAACNQAIEGLIEGEHLYAMLYEVALSDEIFAAPALLRGTAMCYVAAARCMIAIGEEEGACRHLEEGARTVTEATTSLYSKVLLPNLTLLMRPEMARTVSLSRLTELSRLAGHHTTESDLFDEVREAIWADAKLTFEQRFKACIFSGEGAFESTPFMQSLLQSSASRQERREQMIKRASEVVDDVESVLETSSRLQGFAIELAYLREHRIGFDEWPQLTDAISETDEPVA